MNIYEYQRYASYHGDWSFEDVLGGRLDPYKEGPFEVLTPDGRICGAPPAPPLKDIYYFVKEEE